MFNRILLCNSLLALIVWGAWFFYTSPDSFHIVAENWQISVTMIFGSFIAGATSEGGGAIAFPVFTKVLHIAALDAKIFSLSIQSVGMLAATLTIIMMRIAVEWRLVIWCSVGGLFGVILGAGFLAPYVPASLLKMLFTVMISSFAITLAILNWKPRAYNQILPFFTWREKLILTLTGFFGGIMTGLVGNGIDIICFSVMVLLFRLTEKISTPTSVVLMAINSLFGFLLHVFVLGGFNSQVQQYWLAAIPVVVVGAPFGAYLCTRLNNKSIAHLLIFLILIELISSLALIPLTAVMASLSLVILLVFCFIYYRMSAITFYCPTKSRE